MFKVQSLVRKVDVTWRAQCSASRALVYWRDGDQRHASLPQLHVCITTMAPGERSEEVWLWYTAVYEAIQEVPHGKVTSYGHIARLVGKRALSHRMTKASC